MKFVTVVRVLKIKTVLFCTIILKTVDFKNMTKVYKS